MSLATQMPASMAGPTSTPTTRATKTAAWMAADLEWRQMAHESASAELHTAQHAGERVSLARASQWWLP